MHNKTLKKLALALTFWLALHASSLKAQIFSDNLPLQAVTTGTNSVDFEFRSDGTLIAKGNKGVGALLSTDLNPGAKMLWYPALGAFRAGNNTGYWNVGNIGECSTAFGCDTRASGQYSVAFGIYSQASGMASAAFGYSTASGDYAVAFGRGQATGYRSTAFNFGNASGEGAVAFGAISTASGDYSTALGLGDKATGAYSTALGQGTTASGNYSTASGTYTTASSYNAFVIGCENTGLAEDGSAISPTAWKSTDPLFEIGNGGTTVSGYHYGNPSLNVPSDAMVVYKDGSAVFQGPVKVAAGGDIPMFTGN